MLLSRKLDEKRINNLIRNNFLKPIDCKLLLDYKYESIILNQDDINYLRECNKVRYDYKKYDLENHPISHFSSLRSSNKYTI